MSPGVRLSLVNRLTKPIVINNIFQEKMMCRISPDNISKLKARSNKPAKMTITPNAPFFICFCLGKFSFVVSIFSGIKVNIFFTEAKLTLMHHIKQRISLYTRKTPMKFYLGPFETRQYYVFSYSRLINIRHSTILHLK